MNERSFDEALLEEPTFEDFVDESEPGGCKYEDFLWAQYDWDKFCPKEYGYQVVRLMGDPNNNRRKSPHSGKYFTIVGRRQFSFLQREYPRWYPLVEYYRDEHGEKTDTVKRIVAHNTEGPRASRKVIYLHRVIAGVEGLAVGDHINGYSLDNRDFNLRPLTVEANNHNLQRARLAFPELLPGVEWRSKDKTYVGGVLSVAGMRIRSDTIWPLNEQRQAWKWTARKKVELFGLKKTANGPNTVPLPKFPPRLRKIFPVASVMNAADDIPF